ncbi:GDSL-type esterase/lipase family protein [Lentisphaera profundi]|uniref:GDSL-type esterase/lipase family protein n=1 Tax=Lentisphaera profundi TaxID=1658616 RepID=A0ABY7VY14_9BACT|nr:GDSL-type esterase/lipase family protein [Lentisphaera profundi]WDE97599.1 GDSL-type esterase/lipase family protein [Lentisphaera profundi]
MNLKYSLLKAFFLSISFSTIAFALPKTISPVPQVHKWWTERHQQKLNERSTEVDLVLIGDSITHYWERSPSYGYFFGDRKTLNLGYGGDRTQNVLWRIQNGELNGLKPKVISLMIGTNNSNHFSPEDTLLGIQKIISGLRLRLPQTKILLSSILPRGVQELDQKNRTVNNSLASLADNESVFFLDVYNQFLGADDKLNMELYYRDGVHLSDQGYFVWANAMENFISKELGDKAKDQEPVSAIIPSMQNGDRHKQKVKEARESNHDLLFIGDSITHFYDREGNFGVPVWNKYYKHRNAMNLGFGGNTTAHVLWRLQNGQIDAQSPKVCVLMIGTNNTHVRKDKAENTFKGIEKIVELLKKKLPKSKILVLSIFPRGADPSDPLRQENEKVNAMLPLLEDNKTIFHLDINQAFLDKKGHLSREFMPDLLHPNTKGYEIWAQAMEPTLSQLLGENMLK